MDDPQNTDGPDAASRREARKALLIRAAYMLLFLLAFSLAQALLTLAAVIQLVLAFAAGAPNGRLVDFGRSLAIWLAETAAFLSFASERRPFPFSPWPSPD